MSLTSALSSEMKPAVPVSPVFRERDERLESLKLLTNQLGHDFNNYLSPILGYVSLIKEDVPAGSLAQQYAAALENAARKTEALLDTVLMASRPQRRYHPRPCDFAQLVEKTLTDWQATLPETAQIQVKKSVAPCNLTLDTVLWREVLTQLFKNARFALATGGTMEVTLLAQRLTTAEAADLGVRGTDTFLLLVRDDGFGMPAAVKARAFEPFFTTRPKNQGQGLGLTMVHSVTRLHGGQVALESAEDLGTSVRIWLPVGSPAVLAPPPPLVLPPLLPRTAPAPVSCPGIPSDASAMAPSAMPPMRPAIASPANVPEPPAVTAPKSPNRKVLLVDDDPLVLEVLKAFLQRANYDVIVAQDGQEGWRLYQRYHPELHLIITDITMPRLGGIELSQQIRAHNNTMKIILVSGDADATRPEALATIPAPLPPLVRKPFTLKGFMEIIHQQLG